MALVTMKKMFRPPVSGEDKGSLGQEWLDIIGRGIYKCVNSSNRTWKLKLSFLEPCTIGLTSWYKGDIYLDVDGVWKVPDKMGANPVSVVGARYGNFNASAYGTLPDWNPGYSDFSIGITIKTDQLSGLQGIFGRIYAGAGFRFGFFHASTQPDKISVQLDTSGGGGAIHTLVSSIEINDNIPHSIIATYDRSSDLCLYINGVLDQCVDISADENINIVATVPLRIGCYNTAGYTPYSFFNGDMIQATIWDRVLDTQEITDFGKGVVFNTVVNLTFDQRSGSEIWDNSGNENNAQLFNSNQNPADPNYFHDKDATGKVKPVNMLGGCDEWIDGDSNKMYIPYKLDGTSLKTEGDVVAGYTWVKTIPPSKKAFHELYSYKFTSDLMDKTNVDIWGNNFTGVADEDKKTWSYHELRDIPSYKELAYKDRIFVGIPTIGPVTDVIVYDNNIIDECLEKTKEFVGLSVTYILVDDDGKQWVDDDGKLVTFDILKY